MKLENMLKKGVCGLLASLFLFSAVFLIQPSKIITAQGSDMTAQQEKAALEQRIKETENKLSELREQSSNTQEYLNTLTNKISYLNEQYDLVSSEVENDKKQIETLKTTYSENEKSIATAKENLVTLQADYDTAVEDFNESYDIYAQRMRAMYISGETNIIVFLITSQDISQLLTRLEMIKRISEMDAKLLSQIDSEIENIQFSKENISKEQQELEQSQINLKNTQTALEKALPELEEKQNELADKKTELDKERSEANSLLLSLNEETGNYTEFLIDDKAAMAEIDAAIEDAADKYQDETTTQKPTEGGGDDSQQTTAKPDTGSKYISLTYPVPSQTKITCAFGEYSGHSGVDFSCPTGSDVVAAESGTVIISADLKNPDGTYRSYGRYIVIMHDKTTSSGDAVYTLYAHNSERLVSAGTYVQKGQKIAESGSTGNSTGPHCHFEVRTPNSSYSACKDPAIYLP